VLCAMVQHPISLRHQFTERGTGRDAATAASSGIWTLKGSQNLNWRENRFFLLNPL